MKIEAIDDPAGAAAPLLGTSNRWGLRPEHMAWIEDFRRRNGRSPRVLSIGNIANNGYRNAIALQAAGIESHVLCYDYWHIMGCPEWEAAHFDPAGLDDFTPRWSTLDLMGYERPRWFAQGRLGTAMDYLISLCESGEHTEVLWHRMAQDRESGGALPPTEIYHQPTPPQEQLAIGEQMALLFALTFPHRQDQLHAAEVVSHAGFILADMSRVRRLLSHYDFVVGYSTDGMIPLLAGRRDYVAYEHGTIRLIPFDRNFQGRMCALSYAQAGDVLITNCDNIAAARRLNLASFRFTPHAIIEEWREAHAHATLRSRLLADHDADFIVFHPSRQHWEKPRNLNYDKANDVLIEAFARLVMEYRPRALLILVDWGATAAQSRTLIEALGVSHRVVWIKPMPVRMMQEYVAASDLLADQFAIGAWGGIMPIGMMLGTPVAIYLNEDLHRWAFSEMPPIFNTRTSQQVLDAMVSLLDPAQARAVSAACRAWYDGYHSLSVVAGRLMDSFLHVEGASNEFARHDVDDQTLGMGRHLSGYVARMSKLAGRFEGEIVPPDAIILRSYAAQDVFCSNYWANEGAAVQSLPEGARIITPPVPWTYAAAVRLDLSDIDFEAEHCWIRIFMGEVTGDLRACTYEENGDRIVDQVKLDGRSSSMILDLKPVSASETLLLFRTGQHPGVATGVFSGAQIIVAPAYHPRRQPRLA